MSWTNPFAASAKSVRTSSVDELHAKLRLMCPVCYGKDLDVLPPKYPGCAAYHLVSLLAPRPVVDLSPVDPVQHIGSCAIPQSWTPLRLLSVCPCNHDASVFEFALPDAGTVLGLPMCSYLNVCAPGREHGGGDAVRSYTAVSSPTLVGRFQVMAKRYLEWVRS
jgi:hypothetical protein